MQKTLQSVSQVSFVFFMVFGIMHITASMLITKGVIHQADWILFNVLDLPFLFTGLIYGSTRMTLSLERITGQLKMPLLICSVLAVMVFLLALYLNFGLSDAYQL